VRSEGFEQRELRGANANLTDNRIIAGSRCLVAVRSAVL
jgi:hypothetical protein